MDILELAFRRVLQNGMTAPEATAMLEQFTRGQGRDIGWNDLAPRLSRSLEERIDKAALGWMMRRSCGAVAAAIGAEVIADSDPPEWLPYKDA